MPGLRNNGSGPSLPPPRPPEYPELYGKRRELAKLLVLEREIGFLEEEVKSVEGLQPASRSCKELVDFVTCSADPLIPTAKKIRTSQRFWKWIREVSCFNVSWIFRCCCSPDPETQHCCDHTICSCRNPFVSCRMPDCRRSSCCNSHCFNECECGWNCCIPKFFSCSSCPSIRSKCHPKCPKLNMCSCCNNSCCYSYC